MKDLREALFLLKAMLYTGVLADEDLVDRAEKLLEKYNTTP